MTWKPVAQIVATPAVLPVFDDAWKTQCKTCRHANVKTQRPGNTVWRCNAVQHTGEKLRLLQSRGYQNEYCIDARLGACGPGATLWKAKR